MKHHRQSQNGFTLIELLLSLSLMALLMGSAYEILTVARKAQNRAQESVRLNQVGRACLSQVRRDMESLFQEASPYNMGLYSQDGETTRDGFSYPGDYVTFLTSAHVARIATSRQDPEDPEVSTAPDLIEVQYFIGSDPDNERVGLIRQVKWRLNNTLTHEEDAWSTEMLAEEVLGLNIRYFDGDQWQEEWDSESQGEFPEALEVSLTLGRVFFEGGEWSAAFPDGRPTSRETYTMVIPLRALPQKKQGAKAPQAGVVR